MYWEIDSWHYKRFRAHVQKVVTDASWKHISKSFSIAEDSDPKSLDRNERLKCLDQVRNRMRRVLAWVDCGLRHAKTCLRANADTKGPDQPAHLRSLIRALTARWHNNWILQNVWMESKYFAHAQNGLNLHILRMFEGTFSLEAAHVDVVAFRDGQRSVCIWKAH